MRDIFKLTVTARSPFTAKQLYWLLFFGYFIVPFILPDLFSTGPLIVILWWVVLSWVVKKKLKPFVYGNIRAWQELWIRLSLLLSLLALGALSTSIVFIRPVGKYMGLKTPDEFLLLQRGLLLAAGLGVAIVVGGGVRYFYIAKRLARRDQIKSPDHKQPKG